MPEKKIEYAVKFSRRARRMRVSVGRDSAVTVTLPQGFGLGAAAEFVKSKFSWIQKSLEYFSQRAQLPHIENNHFKLKLGKREYKKFRPLALAFVTSKVEHWNRGYNFIYKRISIKNQKTRWGSCSKKGNLNFNFKILRLPEILADYLIVHELCHLKEFNHSKNFWQLVKLAIPNYKILRKQLRNAHANLL